MEECRLLEIEGLDSFVNGIERDKDGVKNAIQFDYNNGLAEGSVNKLKVIKLIMYGRNGFELLKSKLLRLELKRKSTNFGKKYLTNYKKITSLACGESVTVALDDII